MKIRVFIAAVVSFILVSDTGHGQDLVPVPDWDLKLTKDWGGFRQKLADKGLVIEANAVHVSQRVFDGGVDRELSGANNPDEGHTLSLELDIKLDTGKANLWPGGIVRLWVETRTGDSVGQRARSATNYDALFPLVEGHGGHEVLAVNEFTLTQFLSEKVGVFGGLIDAAFGDVNDFAGNGRSNDYFLHAFFNGNPVTLALAPDVSLGGGVILLLSERIQGWAGFFNTEGSAGYNPFDRDEGTTFFTEFSRSHVWGGKDGKLTLGGMYGVDMDRTDLFADPRLGIQTLLTMGMFPTTDEDAWAVYASMQQYLKGNAEEGWGVFSRAGVSDGDPHPVEFYASAGLGGTALFESRPEDRFGIGAFWVAYSDDGLPATLDIDDSYGFEIFYTFQVTPWLKITPDLQILESPLPSVDNTTIVGGIRTKIEF
jgi:porin